jgi:hypothetical protein
MAAYASVCQCVAAHAWQLLLCCLVATWLHTTTGVADALPIRGIFAEFSSVPNLILVGHDSSSGTKTISFSEPFAQDDLAATDNYTQLSYNCTVADGCEGGQQQQQQQLSISSETSEGIYINKLLGRKHALAHLYGGNWSEAHKSAPMYSLSSQIRSQSRRR